MRRPTTITGAWVAVVLAASAVQSATTTTNASTVVDVCDALARVTPVPELFEPYRLAAFYVAKNSHTFLRYDWLTAGACGAELGPGGPKIRLFGGVHVARDCPGLVRSWQPDPEVTARGSPRIAGDAAARRKADQRRAAVPWDEYASFAATRSAVHRFRSSFFYAVPEEAWNPAAKKKKSAPSDAHKLVPIARRAFYETLDAPFGMSTLCGEHTRCKTSPSHWSSQLESLWRQGYYAIAPRARLVARVEDLAAGAERVRCRRVVSTNAAHLRKTWHDAMSQVRDWARASPAAPRTPPSLPKTVANPGKVNEAVGHLVDCDAHCEARVRFLYPIDYAIIDDYRSDTARDPSDDDAAALEEEAAALSCDRLVAGVPVGPAAACRVYFGHGARPFAYLAPAGLRRDEDPVLSALCLAHGTSLPTDDCAAAPYETLAARGALAEVAWNDTHLAEAFDDNEPPLVFTFARDPAERVAALWGRSREGGRAVAIRRQLDRKERRWLRSGRPKALRLDAFARTLAEYPVNDAALGPARHDDLLGWQKVDRRWQSSKDVKGVTRKPAIWRVTIPDPGARPRLRGPRPRARLLPPRHGPRAAPQLRTAPAAQSARLSRDGIPAQVGRLSAAHLATDARRALRLVGLLDDTEQVLASDAALDAALRAWERNRTSRIAGGRFMGVPYGAAAALEASGDAASIARRATEAYPVDTHIWAALVESAAS